MYLKLPINLLLHLDSRKWHQNNDIDLPKNIVHSFEPFLILSKPEIERNVLGLENI